MTERSTKIRVITADNVEFIAEIEHLCHSLQLKHMLECHPGIDDGFFAIEDPEPIKLRKTNSKVFKLILEWIERHHKDPLIDEPNSKLLSDDFACDLDEYSNIMKNNCTNTVVQKNEFFKDSDENTNSIIDTIEKLRSASVCQLPSNFLENPKIKPIIDYAEEHKISLNLDDLFGNCGKKNKNGILKIAKTKFEKMDKDIMNNSTAQPFFPPLIPTWDYEFFDRLPKLTLFELVTTSKSLAIYQLNRFACIYIANVMGDSAEKMSEYFTL